MGYPEILLRTLLSVAIGGFIGMERQSRHRPAGFRTHILVCLGSSTIMILSALMIVQYHDLYGIAADPTRLGAQVISGIGFLGAGTIIHAGANIRGLTTAASLWATAAVGLVIGAGYYALALTVAVVLYATLIIFDRLSRRIEKTSNILELIIELANRPETLGNINLTMAQSKVKILDMEFLRNPQTGSSDIEHEEDISIRFVLKLPHGFVYNELIANLGAIDGVVSIEHV